MHVLYQAQSQSNDGLQQILGMLAMTPLYWIPMINPIVTMLTVKQYRLRLLAIFGLGNMVTTPVVPIPIVAFTIGGETAIVRSGLTAYPVDLPQASL